MATTGLEVFDRTLHTTNVWLDEISAEIGPDRHLAWHVLGAVLRSVRDELLVEQSAHFAAQLPLLVRGAYFDQYRPAAQPASARSQEDFIARIQDDLDGARPVKAEDAVAAVMRTLNRHVTEGQVKKVRDSLPKGVRALWPEPEHKEPQHREPPHAGHAGRETSGEGARAAETPRSPAGPQSVLSQAASSQAAPGGQRAAAPPAQSASPSSTPQHAAQPASPRTEPPRPAPHHPEPRHAPQRAASQHPAREGREEIEDMFDEIAAEVDADEEEMPAIGKSRSGDSAQAPIHASGRPAARVQAAPGAAGRTTKPKTGKKHADE